MLNKAKALNGYKLNSKDGVLGGVRDFYFDDTHWVIRYLVADTGNWLKNRQVLLSPYALKEVIRDEKQIAVELSNKQIEESPSLDYDKPVSRQFEDSYHIYYGWPMYWGGPFIWGSYPGIIHDPEKRKKPRLGEKAWDPHLRSIQKVTGYHVQAEDGDIGHVEDFIIDDETWAIRYLVINTGEWLSEKRVLISPRWIEGISFDESKVIIGLTRGEIKKAPEYSDDIMPNRGYEERLHLHYKRQGYWEDASESDVHSG